MDERALNFLKQLLQTSSPSGDEIAASRVWLSEAEAFADEVRTDVRGNAFAILHGGAPCVKAPDRVIFPMCFCYRVRSEVRKRARKAGIHLLFSYGKLT